MPDELYSSQVKMTPQAAAQPADVRAPGLWTRGALAVSESQERMWQRIGQVGQVLSNAGFDLHQKLKHERQVDEFSKAFFQLQAGVMEERTKVPQPLDPDEAQAHFLGAARERLQQTLEGVADPEVKRHLQREYLQHLPPQMNLVLHEARTRQIQDSRATVGELHDQSLRLYGQAQTLEEAAGIQARFFGLVDHKVQSGILHADQGQQIKQQWQKQAAQNQVAAEIRHDPFGAAVRLQEPEKHYPGLAGNETLIRNMQGYARAEVHRAQQDQYARYALGGIQAQLHGTPTLPYTAEQVAADPKLDQMQKAHLLAQLHRHNETMAAGGDLKHDDPQSYREAVTRLHDPDHPLTMEELIKNTDPKQGGGWKLSARTYGQILEKIDSRGKKQEKGAESARKTWLNSWKSQFNDELGLGKPHYEEAVAQVNQAFNDGELGGTPEEVKEKVAQIMRPHYANFLKDKEILGKQKEQQPGWWSRMWGSGGQQEKGPPPRGPQTGTPAPPGIGNDKNWLSEELRGSKGGRAAPPSPQPSPPGGGEGEKSPPGPPVEKGGEKQAEPFGEFQPRGKRKRYSSFRKEE